MSVMGELLPWMGVVGLGVLHGLSPTSGWTLAAGRGLQAGAASRAWRALGPIALGHLASVAAVAWAAHAGLVLDRALAQPLAGAVLLGTAALQWRAGAEPCARRPACTGNAGLAAWSALMASAHGAGLALVPALAPLCLTGSSGTTISPDAVLPAAAALAAHLAAMLLTAGALAAGVCRAARRPSPAARAVPRHACSVALALGGLWLFAGAFKP
jgi:hypothetical protein